MVGQDGPLLKGLLDHLLKKYSIDRRRVVIMGARRGRVRLVCSDQASDQIRAGIGSTPD